ncbi:MAG: DUF4190 domain-containing protein [Flavisolibacter sp.]|nr:DUF4190 domain-containing protein [Flavisolibacter sp.]
MKITLLFTLFFSYLTFFTAQAATYPCVPAKAVTFPDSATAKVIFKRTAKAIEEATGKKLCWYQKLQLKWIQKKLRKAVFDEEHPISETTKMLSFVSLIAAGLGIVALVIGSGIGFLVLTLGSIITGIIALSGNKNKGSNYRTMAIVGIVVGGITLLIAIIAAFLALSALFGFH